MANTRLQVIRSAAICIVLVILCGSGAAATPLQWKLAKGKTYYQRTIVDQQITQTVMGQQQKIEQNMGTGLKLQVLDVDAQGNMRIQYTYLWSRLKQVNPMAQVDYDSSKQPATVPAGAEGFAALIGQSYTVTMTPKGKVLDVNGVDELKAAVLKKLPPGAETGPMATTMAAYTDKNSVKQMTEARTAVYPDKPVNPGESWSKDATMTVGFPITIQAKWTLQKEEAGVATVVSTANMRTDPNKPMDAGGMKLSFEMSGTQEGTAQIAEATGLITSDKERQQLKGAIKVAAPAAGQPAMAVPMTMDTQVTEEMSEQMWKTGPQ